MKSWLLKALESFIILVLIVSPLQAKEARSTVHFPSLDGLQITADTYLLAKEQKNHSIIVLFHQAGWSRGEYIEIAPKLNKLGFNVLAIDQRSGKKINGIVNQTAKGARQAGKATAYLDALPDIEAALLYARTLIGKKGKVIAWGSSYSAALVLQIAGDKPHLADAVLAFSPGEYFKKAGKPSDWVEHSAKNIEVPVFITSAKSEKPRWSNIFKAIKSDKKKSFSPKTKGNHGSRALWNQFSDSDAYWQAVKQFLTDLSF